MPTTLYLAAKVIAALLFSTLSLLLLFAFARIAGGVKLEFIIGLLVIVKLLLGSLPIIALGFAVGFWVPPSSASVISNVISLVMSFASGLFIPFYMLPAFAQRIAPFLPGYHFGLVARSPVSPLANEWQHWLILIGFTFLFSTLAVIGMRRDEARGQ